jgi:hypothetical protein
MLIHKHTPHAHTHYIFMLIHTHTPHAHTLLPGDVRGCLFVLVDALF